MKFMHVRRMQYHGPNQTWLEPAVSEFGKITLLRNLIFKMSQDEP